MTELHRIFDEVAEQPSVMPLVPPIQHRKAAPQGRKPFATQRAPPNDGARSAYAIEKAGLLVGLFVRPHTTRLVHQGGFSLLAIQATPGLD